MVRRCVYLSAAVKLLVIKAEKMLAFQELYKEEIRSNLQKKFNYKNPMQVPKLEKICLNMGRGEAVSDNKLINLTVDELSRIAGQKPVITTAKKSIAAFKLRQGMPIGCKVTLRGKRMYEFLERLVLVALPRVRDFRGLSTRSFNGGSYSVGLKEQIVFPEIDYDKIDKIRGLDIVIVTTSQSEEETKELLSGFKLPFVSN